MSESILPVSPSAFEWFICICMALVPYVDFSFDFLLHPPGLFCLIDPPGYLLEGGESCLTRGKMGAIRPRWAQSKRSRRLLNRSPWQRAAGRRELVPSPKSERPAVGEQVVVCFKKETTWIENERKTNDESENGVGRKRVELHQWLHKMASKCRLKCADQWPQY